MHVLSTEDTKPLQTPNGEIIHELLGRYVGEGNIAHSVAHITVPAGKASLRHYHPVAQEAYYVLSGVGYLELGLEKRHLKPGELAFIPPRVPHKIASSGDQDLVMLVTCAPAWEPSNSIWLERWEDGAAVPV